MVNQGDLMWLDFDPHLGHEQGGRRPGLIVSEDAFNYRSNVYLVCPVSRADKGYPHHIRLDARTITGGVILCDHARSMDISYRRPDFIERVPDDILFEVTDTLVGILAKSPAIVYQPE
jgi:mRNA interferase MazF